MASQAIEQFLLLVLMSELLTYNDLLTSLLLQEYYRDVDVISHAAVCNSEEGGGFKT